MNIQHTEGQICKSKQTIYQNEQRGCCVRFLQWWDFIGSNANRQICRFSPLTVLSIGSVCNEWLQREEGKNPELQVTDHGSRIACMQTGRGRKKYTRNEGGGALPTLLMKKSSTN